MNSFMKSMGEITIFMICAGFLLQLTNTSTGQKHLKLLVSIMLLIQIGTPVLQLVTKEELHLSEQMESYRKIMKSSTWEEELGGGWTKQEIIQQLERVREELALEATEWISKEMEQKVEQEEKGTKEQKMMSETEQEALQNAGSKIRIQEFRIRTSNEARLLVETGEVTW